MSLVEWKIPLIHNFGFVNLVNAVDSTVEAHLKYDTRRHFPKTKKIKLSHLKKDIDLKCGVYISAKLMCATLAFLPCFLRSLQVTIGETIRLTEHFFKRLVDFTTEFGSVPVYH